MRTSALFAFVAAALVASSVRADSFETEDIDNGNWKRLRGSTLCPEKLIFDGEDEKFDAKDIEADGEDCTGSGSVTLKQNPSSGGTKLTAALRDIDDRDQSQEGATSGAMTCGRLPIPSGTYFQFFSPEDEFKVNPSEIFGTTNHPLAVGSADDYEFKEDVNYFILGETCLYSQDGRLGSALENAGDSVCFPATATVELEDASVVPMSALKIGDRVRTGPNSFSPVFMFTHKMPETSFAFVSLRTASGASISLTKGHYIFADGRLVAASEVAVGSTVTLASGARDTVVSIGSKAGKGLYNPQTVDGNIVVDGILTSTYTTAVEPALAHAILAPFRFLSRVTGFAFTALESGGGSLADVAPRGAAMEL